MEKQILKKPTPPPSLYIRDGVNPRIYRYDACLVEKDPRNKRVIRFGRMIQLIILVIQRYAFGQSNR